MFHPCSYESIQSLIYQRIGKTTVTSQAIIAIVNPSTKIQQQKMNMKLNHLLSRNLQQFDVKYQIRLAWYESGESFIAVRQMSGDGHDSSFVL